MDDAEQSRRMSMTPLAEMELSDWEGVRVVAVEGEIDISNIGELERATLTLPNETLGLVLDLSSASYIDSATLGLLFKLRRALRRRRQVLCVVCAQGSSARRVLELTGFDREHTHVDREAAIASIRADT